MGLLPLSYLWQERSRNVSFQEVRYISPAVPQREVPCQNPHPSSTHQALWFFRPICGVEEGKVEKHIYRGLVAYQKSSGSLGLIKCSIPYLLKDEFLFAAAPFSTPPQELRHQTLHSNSPRPKAGEMPDNGGTNSTKTGC